jgi:hypothetical protein
MTHEMQEPIVLIYFVRSLLPSLIRPIHQIRDNPKQTLRLGALASKTKQADSLRKFATPLTNPRHPTTTNEKKPVIIRQIRGKTKKTLRLCALASKTK